MDCIFCKIAKGEIPSTKIYEDGNFIAFLDIAPGNFGHTLVMPKEHFETFTDLPENMEKQLMERVKKIASAVVQGTNAEGFNILINNKKVAGQLVPHVHVHIIPRFTDDGIELTWPQKKYAEAEMDKYKESIAKFINE